MYFLMHFRLGKKVFRVNIPLEGLWYFDELVTVNSTAALDVKVVIKKCIMSMIRAALNMIPQLGMLAKSQSYKVHGSFHSWVNGKYMIIFTLYSHCVCWELCQQGLWPQVLQTQEGTCMSINVPLITLKPLIQRIISFLLFSMYCLISWKTCWSCSFGWYLVLNTLQPKKQTNNSS